MSNKKRLYKLYSYSSDDLDRALEKIKKGHSFGSISKEFNIPKSTLFAKIKNYIPVHTKRGPDTVLTKEEENRLEKWILYKARLGFPMYPTEVKIAVQRILNEAQRTSIFKDNMPGDKWMMLFLKRHPEIKKKHTEVISKSRASVTEEKLRSWYTEVKNILQEENVLSVLERPESIFNGDESGFQLCPKSGLLLGPRKEKNFYEISAGQEKETITVLCTFSASGASLPPMIMLPYKRIPAHLIQSIPPDWAVGRSDSGWMVSSTFYEYMANVFYPWCIKNNIQFPVIYFLDGHQSHLSLELSDFCKQKSIILVSLFPNSTHITQPCDVAIFRALKLKWRKEVQMYKQETQTSLTKANFAPLLKKAFDQLSAETIRNGFKKCGLFPFDENAVDYDQCISTRRKKIDFTGSDKHSNIPMSLEQLTHVKMYFECAIEEEKLKKFIEMRNCNEKCAEEVYLLWKKCIDALELQLSENGEDRIATLPSCTTEPDRLECVQSVDTLISEREDNVSLSCNTENVINLCSVENMQIVLDNEVVVNSTENFMGLPLEEDMHQVLFQSEVDFESVVDIENVVDEISLETIPIIDLCDGLIENKIDQNSIKNREVMPKTQLIDRNQVQIDDRKESYCDKTNNLNDSLQKDLEEKICTEYPSQTVESQESICLEDNNNNSIYFAECSSHLEITAHPNTSKVKNLNSIPSNNESDIWKKHLFWPSSVSNKKNKKNCEPLPCVLTSKKWREIQLQKKLEKDRKEAEAQERILKRKIKKEKDEIKKKKLREERDFKKLEAAKKKEEMLRKKQEKAKAREEKLRLKERKAKCR